MNPFWENQESEERKKSGKYLIREDSMLPNLTFFYLEINYTFQAIKTRRLIPICYTISIHSYVGWFSSSRFFPLFSIVSFFYRSI